MTRSDYSKYIVELGTQLLRLKKEIMKIDGKYEPLMGQLADSVAYTIGRDLTEKERGDFSTSIRNGSFETYTALSVDVPTFHGEVSTLMEKSLDNAIISALDGVDITPQTLEQNLELLKETSFMLGFLQTITTDFNVYMERVPMGKYWLLIVNYLRKKTRIDQEKLYLISTALINHTVENNPKITDIVVDFEPLLGHKEQTASPDYLSKFRKRMNEATKEWYRLGTISASSRFGKIKDSLDPYIGIV